MANILYKGKYQVNAYWEPPPTPDYEPLLWTPSNLATDLWLDAKISDAVILSSGKVSQWLDLSGNNRHAVQATSSLMPTYVSGEYLTFNLNSLDVTPYPLRNAHSIFIVCKRDGSHSNAFSNLSFVYCSAVTADIGNINRSVQLSWNDANGFRDILRPGATGFTVSDRTRNDNVNIHTHISTVGGTHRTRLNGGADITLSNTSPNTTVAPLMRIGAAAQWNPFPHSPDFFMVGKMYEMIFIGSQLSQSDYEKVEGYLAHKWGLAGDLPSGHPWKNAPPTVV